MEALGAVASAFAVAQLATKVIGYINSAAGAQDARQRLQERVKACRNVTEQIDNEANSSSEESRVWSEKIKKLQEEGGPLQRLHELLTTLSRELDPHSFRQKTLSTLKWPFKEKEIEKMMTLIDSETNLLELSLVIDSHTLSLRIQNSAKQNQELLQSIKEALSEHWRDQKDHNARIEHAMDRLHIRQDDHEQEEKRIKILDWLTPLDFSHQHHEISSRRHEETGRWLLESTEYQSWQGTSSQTLLCWGIPGAGKTFLASIVIDDILKRFSQDDSVATVYIYFDYQQQDKQRLDHLLGSLLRQVIESRESQEIPQPVQDMYDGHNKPKGSKLLPGEIKNALRQTIEGFSKTIIIIDALDECKTTERTQELFLKGILELQRQSGINLLVTTRNIPDILESFQHSPRLEIRATDHDIGKYLEARMEPMPKFVQRSPKLQDEIKATIIKIVQGMFLLARLHFDSLVGKPTPKAITLQLKNLSSGKMAYDTAYENAMESINNLSEYADLARKALIWIVHARRPLKKQELQHALAVEFGESELDEYNIPDLDLVVSACAGLVTVDEETGKVRLIHYTTQQYFEQTSARWFPDAQAEIVKVCLTYLSFDTFSDGYTETADDFKKRQTSSPLYRYAACYWGNHILLLRKLEGALDFLALAGNVEAAGQALFAYKGRRQRVVSSQKAARSITGLHLAAYFGLRAATVKLLDGGYDVNVKDSSGSTALFYASNNGHAASVETLLARGATIEVQDGTGRTPLSYAAEHGKTAIVKILLDKGAEIDIKDEDDRTPLSWAVDQGHEEIVRLLLDGGANREVKSNYGRTPLSWAVGNGHETVVRALLETGVDTEVRSSYGRTPLSWASGRGQEAIVKLLLDAGANPNAQDEKTGLTPLCHASGRGYEPVARLLLQRGADPLIKDHKGLDALEHAKRRGYESLVKLVKSFNKGLDGPKETE